MTEEIEAAPTEQLIVLDEYSASTQIMNMPFDEAFIVDDAESINTSTEEAQILLNNAVPITEVEEQQDDQCNYDCEEIIDDDKLN